MGHTYIVGEVAACHDSSLDKAFRLIGLCAAIGCDAVKTQWLSSPDRLAERRHAPEYLAAYRTLAFPREWFPSLKRACEDRGIELIATCYLPEDLAVVAPYVKRFKIASFEATDAHFIALHAEFGKSLIVSLGMAADPGAILNAWARAGGKQANVTLLHCLSAYPAPAEEMNLRRLRNLRDYRGYRIGLSDHSRHPWTGALAVAVGDVDVIEFHVRLDDTDSANADYAVARTPEESLDYVRNIRFAEQVLGSGDRRVMPSEEPYLRYRVGAPPA